jgi:hypothetical protein
MEANKLIAALIFVSVCIVTHAKFLCYSGSSLYQLKALDCGAQNTSYTGSWYCAKSEICEAFMDSNRECVTTRGCATEDQCRPTGSTLDGLVQLNGQNPGGMSITTSCCVAGRFDDDDIIPPDYDDICNSGNQRNLLSKDNLFSLLMTLSICATLWMVGF